MDENNMNDMNYTDPNEGAVPNEDAVPNEEPKDYSREYQQQYQSNYEYNVGTGRYDKRSEEETDSSPLSLVDWILMLLLMSIPCVNIVLCIVWGFGDSGNVNRRNFCRAQLIFIAIGIVLTIIGLIILALVGLTTGARLFYYYY